MRNIDISQEADKIVKFIKTATDTAGFKDVVVGLSGGVDSAVATALAVKALGKTHVYPMLLPSSNSNQESLKNAHLLIKQLNIPQAHVHQINISPMVDEFSKTLNLHSGVFCHPRESGDLKIPGQAGNDRKDNWNNDNQLNNLRLGNITARTRMIILFDFAKKLPGLVLGTENKSEHILGYFTRFGDEASDIEPIIHLYKTEVYKLAKYLQIPQKIINQKPAAGLWPGQTDEGELGFTYKQADEVIYVLFEAKEPEATLIKQGINLKTIDKIKNRIAKNSFKFCIPYKLMVDS